MPFSDSDLSFIYDKTAGHCYHCGKKIAWRNYGLLGGRGAWEVDHSNPRARGGSSYYRNLFPSYVACNRSKGSNRSGQFGSGRFTAEDFQRARRKPGPKKKFKNLRLSDIAKLTAADRARYWRELQKLDRLLRSRGY